MRNRSSLPTTPRRGLAAALLAFAGCLLPFGSPARTGTNAQASIEAGRKLFAGSCSNVYCHGSAGAGGSGPKLKDRNFTAEYLTRVIAEGITGTGMPGFKKRYNPEQIAQITTYVLSLSPANSNAAPSSSVDPHFSGAGPRPEEPKPEAPKPEAAAPKDSARPPALINEAAELRGDPVAGRELFFDSGQTANCRVCHTVQGIGGKVGPDLTEIATQSPHEILRSIVSAGAVVSEKYALIALTTRDGMRLTGIKRDESPTLIRLYETSTLPPVSRAVPRSEVVKIETLPNSAMPSHYGTQYSLKQLLDLVSFLKSSDPVKQPVSVTLKDLF